MASQKLLAADHAVELLQRQAAGAGEPLEAEPMPALGGGGEHVRGRLLAAQPPSEGQARTA